MVARTSVINLSGDHEETVERLAKHLGRNKLRRKLFNTVYGPGRLPRSRKQIMMSADIAARNAHLPARKVKSFGQIKITRDRKLAIAA